jgi:hypothetical protein
MVGGHVRSWSFAQTKFAVRPGELVAQLLALLPRTGEDGNGTWHTLDYAAGKGLPHLIVPLQIEGPESTPWPRLIG